MGYDVQENKRWTAEFAAPVQGALGQGGVELLFCELTQISSAGFSYSILGLTEGWHRWAILFVPTGKSFVLEIVNPAFLTGQDMHKLAPDGGMTESGNRLVPGPIRHGFDMFQ